MGIIAADGAGRVLHLRDPSGPLKVVEHVSSLGLEVLEVPTTFQPRAPAASICDVT